MLISVLSRRRIFKHSIHLMSLLVWRRVVDHSIQLPRRRSRHMFPVSPFLLFFTSSGCFLSCMRKGFFLLTYLTTALGNGSSGLSECILGRLSLNFSP